MILLVTMKMISLIRSVDLNLSDVKPKQMDSQSEQTNTDAI